MKLLNSTVVALLVLWFLTACDGGNYQTEEYVDIKTKEFFSALQANDIDKVLSYYSEEFYDSRPRQLWQKTLTDLINKYGKIDKILLVNKQADTRFSGKFFIYQYNTIHGKKRIKHILTWIRSVDNDEIKLVGHMIK